MDTRFRIKRCASAADAPTLARLGAETFTESFGHFYKPDDLAAFLADNHSRENYHRLLLDRDHAVWAARDKADEMVGLCVTGPCRLPMPGLEENSGELLRLYVRKNFQGSGLGQRMLAIALDWLEEHFDHLYLSVYSKNHGAQQLYARHGFEKVHDYHFMVGAHADPEFIMKRRESNKDK